MCNYPCNNYARQKAALRVQPPSACSAQLILCASSECSHWPRRAEMSCVGAGRHLSDCVSRGTCQHRSVWIPGCTRPHLRLLPRTELPPSPTAQFLTQRGKNINLEQAANQFTWSPGVFQWNYNSRDASSHFNNWCRCDHQSTNNALFQVWYSEHTLEGNLSALDRVFLTFSPSCLLPFGDERRMSQMLLKTDQTCGAVDGAPECS